MCCGVWASVSKAGKRAVCVSTQLIEAGVDISFDCVVRSMAGLSSVAQAAGRCNRHGEADCRPVYLIGCADENLDYLPEIDDAAQAMRRFLERQPEETELLSPGAIREYYRIYYAGEKQALAMEYPFTLENFVPPMQVTMADLLSCNSAGVEAYRAAGHAAPGSWELRQAFGTAEGQFEAISDETVPVLVPYGEGKEKIAALLAGHCTPQMLRGLEPYVVALSRGEIRRLATRSCRRWMGRCVSCRRVFTTAQGRAFAFHSSRFRLISNKIKRRELFCSTAIRLN